MKHPDDTYSAASNAFLVPYACVPEQSRGRLHPETEDPGRSVYQRDRDRIIHSTAFRRLEYKTQVFVYHEGDHYRTRLTHSLEVAQLSRSVARALRLDEDLAEAIALAHDLGHPPFGHAGEDALKEAMHPYGGFDHNAQTIRILTRLESRYAKFDGLNLTWECLEGIAKHNGPLGKDIPRALEEYNRQHDLELNSWPCLEAQVAAQCDDIAYQSHDIEDGLRAGLFTLDALETHPLVGPILKETRKEYGDVEEGRLTHEVHRRMINRMVNDLINTTLKAIEAQKISDVGSIRAAGEVLAQLSETMRQDNAAIRAFLFEHMYQHYRVNRMTNKARRVVRALFDFFLNDPTCLPTSWYRKTEGKDTRETAVIICDFIAGMTDRFALKEYARIFDTSYKLLGEN